MHPSEMKLMLTTRLFLFPLHPLQLEREFPAWLQFGEPTPPSQHTGEWEGALAQGLAAAGEGQMWRVPRTTASSQGA